MVLLGLFLLPSLVCLNIAKGSSWKTLADSNYSNLEKGSKEERKKFSVELLLRKKGECL